MLKLKQSPRHTVDILFLLMVLTLFSATAFLLIFLGAKQYQSIADRMADNYELRTAAAYLEEKINQNDVSGSFSITNIGSSDAIALTETVMEQIFTTYIYVYDGYLREIYVSQDSTFTPEDGQPIIEAEDFHISEVSENLYECTIAKASVKASDEDSTHDAPGNSMDDSIDISIDNSADNSMDTSMDDSMDDSMDTCTLYISLNAEP